MHFALARVPRGVVLILDKAIAVGYNCIKENAMNYSGRHIDTPTISRRRGVRQAQVPKPENLLKTKGKVLDFPLPKAENILKISQLLEM
jgi:hypothetical protein